MREYGTCNVKAGGIAGLAAAALSQARDQQRSSEHRAPQTLAHL